LLTARPSAAVNPHLQLTDLLAQARRLAVNRILEALHELLDVGDPCLERG
jgi:hypothetical protein